jgi:hemerythrin-like domain-containing protein
MSEQIRAMLEMRRQISNDPWLSERLYGKREEVKPKVVKRKDLLNMIDFIQDFVDKFSSIDYDEDILYFTYICETTIKSLREKVEMGSV